MKKDPLLALLQIQQADGEHLGEVDKALADVIEDIESETNEKTIDKAELLDQTHDDKKVVANSI